MFVCIVTTTYYLLTTNYYMGIFFFFFVLVVYGHCMGVVWHGHGKAGWAGGWMG